jgi:hypothetical protein
MLSFGGLWLLWWVWLFGRMLLGPVLLALVALVGQGPGRVVVRR